MSEAMHSEFDTVAGWTADAALALGRDHHVPAGCRGSGGPRTFEALLDALRVTRGSTLLDVGAGVGGPAEYARARRGARPLLVEPEAGACTAARRLFGLPTVRGSATALPVASASLDAVWSLGVLCTVPEQRDALAELRRVVRPGGRIGVVVYVACRPLPEQPDGNSFPSEQQLHDDVHAAGLSVASDDAMASSDQESATWRARLSAVEDELERRHDDRSEWRTAQRSSATIGRLLAQGHLAGRVVVLTPVP